MLVSEPSADLGERLQQLASDATVFLQALEPFMPPEEDHFWNPNTPDYWSFVPAEAKDHAQLLDHRFLPLAKEAVSICKRSSLVNPADIRDLQVAVKTIRSALFLRYYQYSDGEAVHDEGTVLGYTPPTQTEGALSPQGAVRTLTSAFVSIHRILDLTDDQSHGEIGAVDNTVDSRFRRDTAFVMMWMDPTEPSLEDVRDAVREVFDSFGIRAIRADDVEHEGVITDRIIQEIKNSEFLLADLTGARPSVYYEVGYAHALGKRVILYRKEGTPIHFDLAGYNCPEYRNIRDLKDKLTRRIEQMTNRKPQV